MTTRRTVLKSGLGLAAGLALAVFLVTWLKPVRVDDRALTT